MNTRSSSLPAPGLSRINRRHLPGLALGMMTFFVLGCGSIDENQLADPTNQLPGHLVWNSYNLYRYDPAPASRWTPIVTQGQLVTNLPALGQRPVLIAHGLGGSIRANTFNGLAQHLVDNQVASTIVGFEYDSQDSIASNGSFYTQALQLLNSGPDRVNWGLIGHSMGGLVARASIQSNTLPIAAQGNRLITLGTPHFGSAVANAAQESNSSALRGTFVGVLNQGGFVNADGNPSEVSLLAQGITDLRTDSVFLADLNNNIGNGGQVNTFTLAGTRTGSFQTLNDLLGVSTNDGFVTIASANPVELFPLATAEVPADHVQLVSDPNTFDFVRQVLGSP